MTAVQQTLIGFNKRFHKHPAKTDFTTNEVLKTLITAARQKGKFMKKVLLSLSLLVFTSAAFSQQAETESFDYSVSKALQIKDQIQSSAEIKGVVAAISSARKFKCSTKDVYSVSYKFEQLDEDNSQIMLFVATVPCLVGKTQLPIKISGKVLEDQNLNMTLLPLSYELY